MYLGRWRDDVTMIDDRMDGNEYTLAGYEE